MKVSTLKENPNNPRTISNKSLEKLKNSIAGFKKMMKYRGIVVDKNMLVLGGNMRLRALKALGYTEIPDEWVKVADDLTPEEEREFIIQDNVSGGEWDFDTLVTEWDDMPLEEMGLTVPEYYRNKHRGVEDDEFDIPKKIKTDIKPGDLFQIGSHRLLCGDATNSDDIEKLAEDQMVDLVVTDPPYNVDYTGKTKDALKLVNDKMSDSAFYEFLYDFFTTLKRHVKDGGAWYVWHADSEGANFRSAMANAGMRIRQCLIWKKNSMVMGRQDYHWQHEPCLYGWKEGAHKWYSDRKQTTILEFDRPKRNAEHPTMKPVPLIAYQIQNNSKSGDIVADTFLGSGTTMVACHQLHRRCFGMELDPVYCQVTIERMKALEPGIKIKKISE